MGAAEECAELVLQRDGCRGAQTGVEGCRPAAARSLCPRARAAALAAPAAPGSAWRWKGWGLVETRGLARGLGGVGAWWGGEWPEAGLVTLHTASCCEATAFAPAVRVPSAPCPSQAIGAVVNQRPCCCARRTRPSSSPRSLHWTKTCRTSSEKHTSHACSASMVRGPAAASIHSSVAARWTTWRVDVDADADGLGG